jgi:Zn-dependent protease with chaperone function
MEREVSCRHCATRTRLDVDKALRSPDAALCGRCKGKLFLGPGEVFKDLDPRAYEHPLDRQALEALRRIPGTRTFLRFLLKHGLDRTYRLLMKQNFVEVRTDRVPSIHRAVAETARVMDLGTVPETYIVQHPVPNAWTTGVERYQLCLTTALIELLDEEELRAVIAHEVGHMQAGHVLYKTAAMILYYVIGRLLARTTALAGPVLIAMYFAFRKWERCSELTADRAELLVTRAYRTCLRSHLKLASGSPKTTPELDVDQLLAQAREVEELTSESWLDQIIVDWQQAGMTHPFVVWRAKHVDEWARSAELWEVLSGNYRRREGPPRRVPEEDVAEEKEKGKEKGGKLKGLVDELKKIFE